MNKAIVFFAFFLSLLIVSGCANQAAAPTATHTLPAPPATFTAEPSATFTPPPTQTPTSEPTSTATLIPPTPTATVTSTPEILPLAGKWRAKGVDANWTMEFEITYKEGKPFFRLTSSQWFICGSTRVRLRQWGSSEPIEDRSFQNKYLSGQVISPESIEGVWDISACDLQVRWVGNLFAAATPEPTLTP